MPPNDVQPDTTPSASRPRSYSGGYMQAGKTAEAIFLDFLWSHKETIYVEDVRSQKQWQECDVDFRVLRNGSDNWLDVEGKHDRRLDRSGYWLFELFRVNHTAPANRLFVDGWSVRSAASHLLFYAPFTNRIHSIRVRDYRLACSNAVRLKLCRYDLVPTDTIKTTVNAYFPEEFVQEMQSYQVFDADNFAQLTQV